MGETLVIKFSGGKITNFSRAARSDIDPKTGQAIGPRDYYIRWTHQATGQNEVEQNEERVTQEAMEALEKNKDDVLVIENDTEMDSEVVLNNVANASQDLLGLFERIVIQDGKRSDDGKTHEPGAGAMKVSAESRKFSYDEVMDEKQKEILPNLEINLGEGNNEVALKSITAGIIQTAGGDGANRFLLEKISVRDLALASGTRDSDGNVAGNTASSIELNGLAANSLQIEGGSMRVPLKLYDVKVKAANRHILGNFDSLEADQKPMPAKPEGSK